MLLWSSFSLVKYIIIIKFMRYTWSALTRSFHQLIKSTSRSFELNISFRLFRTLFPVVSCSLSHSFQFSSLTRTTEQIVQKAIHSVYVCSVRGLCVWEWDRQAEKRWDTGKPSVAWHWMITRKWLCTLCFELMKFYSSFYLFSVANHLNQLPSK